jgi:ketosteroid isomerase-like protein
MSDEEEILAIETELAQGDDSTYVRYLTDDAIVIVPGMTLTKDECVEAMAASPGWLSVRLTSPEFIPLGGDQVMVTYEFEGERSGETYDARMTSIYRRTGDGWRLRFHQQTPSP